MAGYITVAIVIILRELSCFVWYLGMYIQVLVQLPSCGQYPFCV